MPPILHQNMKINSSEQPNPNCTFQFRSSDIGLTCFTMTFGAISNLTALGILAKSRSQFRRRSKGSFLLLTVALLLADLGGHMIPGVFALYLHLNSSCISPTFCKIFGAVMVHFGLCPLLLGCAMAVERCVAITKPFFHSAVVTVTHVQRVVLLLFSLALMLAILPFFVGVKYTSQFPGTWCFLPIHNQKHAADINMVVAFSCLGLIALTVSLLCNIVSVLALLRARTKCHNVDIKSVNTVSPAARCYRRPSSASTSFLFCSLDVELMVQLVVITVVSCVCWSPFLIHILVMQFNNSPDGKLFTLSGLRIASWNQILDPWVYILLRRAVFYRVCCACGTKRPMMTVNSEFPDPTRETQTLQ